jgi:hypothetical protein
MAETAKVSFDATPNERKAIERCAERAKALGMDGSRLEIQMDLTAAHANGCPLDLEKLEGFDDFNFSHDLWGIRAHLDRRSGNLTRHFLPRSSRRMAGGAK